MKEKHAEKMQKYFDKSKHYAPVNRKTEDLGFVYKDLQTKVQWKQKKCQ